MKVEYINEPYLPVTVLVIGAGGNGSSMITQLGRINHALKALGKPGLHVTLMDDDLVSESNIGRQLFAESEIGQYKSNVIISRINRFYGTRWESLPEKFLFANKAEIRPANVIITCTDNMRSRHDVNKYIKAVTKQKSSLHEWTFHYWLDMGNTKNVGQIICGSPKYKLPTVIELYPEWKKMEAKDNTPSCSIAEALAKQDLFINTFISNMAAKLFWEMLTAAENIDWRGAYMNLNTLNFKKIAA